VDVSFNKTPIYSSRPTDISLIFKWNTAGTVMEVIYKGLYEVTFQPIVKSTADLFIDFSMVQDSSFMLPVTYKTSNRSSGSMNEYRRYIV